MTAPTPALRGYAALIADVAPTLSAPERAVVEDFMREESGGCLDALSKRAFNVAVRRAVQFLVAVQVAAADGDKVWQAFATDRQIA